MQPNCKNLSSGVPSLMTDDKPCPQLQPSLALSQYLNFLIGKKPLRKGKKKQLIFQKSGYFCNVFSSQNQYYWAHRYFHYRCFFGFFSKKYWDKSQFWVRTSKKSEKIKAQMTLTLKIVITKVILFF